MMTESTEYKDLYHWQYLTVCREEFKRSKNPFWVWNAIAFVSELEYPMDYQSWIKEYLSQTAENLISLDGTGKGFPQRVTNIIGLKQGNLTTFHIRDRNFKVYQFVESHIDDLSQTECFKLAEKEFNLTNNVIRKIYYGERKRQNDLG